MFVALGKEFDMRKQIPAEEFVKGLINPCGYTGYRNKLTSIKAKDTKD